MIGADKSMHPAALSEEALLSACTVQRTRRSGPGGQHRNKVETAVVITHTSSGISGEASERRSQAQNRSQALQRLRVKLALEVRQPPAGAAPSELWLSRVRGRQIRVSRDHRDFPALLAEALDVLAAEHDDLQRAAQRLQISFSQLVKFFRCEPPALEQLNRRRATRGERRLT